MVVNTFAFGTPTVGAPTPGELASISNSLIDFYNGVGVSTRTLASYMSVLVHQGALKHQIRLYDEAAPLGSPPVFSQQFTLAAIGNIPLPAEVSMCLSFRAAPQPPVPPSRLRGRIYFPLLSTEALGLVSSGDARPSVTFQNTLADAGLRLATAVGHDWSVWSRANGIFNPVVDMYVDNAFDTQRRRGAVPSTRVSRSTNV
jgi:hypothetical protein